MIERFYVDLSNNECYIKKPTAPSVEILTICRGSSIYVEHWKVVCSNGNRLDVAFTTEEYKNRYMIRIAQAERHGCELVRMLALTIPSIIFDEFVEKLAHKKRPLYMLY